MTLLVEYARNELGMPMRGQHRERHIGWTTDPEKAEAMRRAGAVVLTVQAGHIGAVAMGDSPNRIVGYEVSFGIGRELGEQIAA